MIRTDLGAVTAYAYAKQKGYSGTEEEFAEDVAALEDNASKLNALYPADTTLSIAGKAADAKAVGNVKDSVNAEIEATSDERILSITYWEQGLISPTTGINGTSTYSIRTKANIFIENANIIKAKSGYGFRIYAYQKDGTYVGAWDGNAFSKTWDYILVTEFVTIKYSDYKFRVVLCYSDLADITVAKHDNLILLYEGFSDLQTNVNGIANDVYDSLSFSNADWRVGYISPTTGANATMTPQKSISFVDGFYVSANQGYRTIKCTSDYAFNVYAYLQDGTYEGAWDGNTFSKTWDYLRVNEFDVKSYPNYKFRIALWSEDEHTMVVSEKSNITFTISKIEQLDVLDSEINNLLSYTPLDGMELGNINGAPIPNEPWWVVSSSRVRTMKNHLIPLSVGDKITLTDYSNATMYVMWENTDGTWSGIGWLSADYEVTADGKYALLLRNANETTVSNINDLASLVVIYKQTSIYNDVYADIEKNQRRDWFVKSINHRGFSRTAPENTLPAFKLSAKYGWDYVETDVRFTSDGVAVLLHDASINRTARNANGSEISSTIDISDITYAQALTYDFGIWMGTQYQGTKIPKLEEFLILCKKLSLNVYLELKNYSDSEVKYITSMVNRCGMRKHTSYICYAFSALESVLSYDPEARVGLLGNLDSSYITMLQELKTDANDVFMDADVNSVTTALVNDFADAKIPLEVYTPNDEQAINSLDRYITGVSSDFNIAGKDLYNLNIV